MNFKLTATALGAALLVSAVASCSDDSSNSDSTLLGLTALALQPVIQGSPEARTAAAAAMNAANAAAQAGAVQGNFALNNMNPKQMLAFARNRIIARQLGARPQVMPTAMNCADGQCDFTSDEVVTGTFNCMGGGGTATANGVIMRRASAFPNFDVRNNGSFTFAACQQFGPDYGRLPTIGYRNFTLTGDLTMNTIIGGTISGEGNLLYGNLNTQGRLQASQLTVDGEQYAFDITIVSQDNSVSDYSLFTGPNARLTVTLNGAVDISGTVNGESVLVKTPYSGTVVCRAAGGAFTCE